MKIRQDMHTEVKSVKGKKTITKSGRPRFDHLVQSQVGKLQASELQKLMNDIAEQGERLARFRTAKELVRFKRMIKSFIKEVVQNGLQLDSSHSFNLDGQSRKLAIVKEIDGRLVDLTDEVIGQEGKSVDLLDAIGEIKGLLVNLYS